MPLAAGFTHKETVPNEYDAWIEFAELGMTDTKAARDERRRQSAKELQDLGGDLYSVMIRQNAARTVVDPINTHDTMTLLERGVVAWSYDPALPPLAPDYREQRRQLLGRLKDRTATWAARMVMQYADVENAWGGETGMIEGEVGPTRAIEVPARVSPNGTSSSSFASTGS